MSVVTQTSKPSRKTSGKMKKRQDEFVSLDGLLTVEQWAALPEVKPPYELMRGRLVQKMVTTNEHNWAVGELLTACKLWARTSRWRFFSEGSGVAISGRDGYIPDVMGYAPSTALEGKATYNEAPFLVAEVLSASTAHTDRTEKLENYAHIGVPIYILVDTDARTIEVYHLHSGAYGSPEVWRDNDVWQPAELPGLRVELARLWF